MKHLIKHDAAIVCTSPDGLEKTLTEAFCNEDLRRRVAQNGLVTAREYHDAAKNSEMLKKILSDL